MNSYRRRRQASMTVRVLALGAALVLLFGVGIVCCQALLPTKYVTFTVKSKESVNTSNGHQYRVYTTNGVYKVEDSVINFTFRSADRYNNLNVGHTYRCKVQGYRSGVLSSFPNILTCTTLK